MKLTMKLLWTAGLMSVAVFAQSASAATWLQPCSGLQSDSPSFLRADDRSVGAALRGEGKHCAAGRLDRDTGGQESWQGGLQGVRLRNQFTRLN